MTTKLYELDPDGDLYLVLRNPTPCFAAWDEAQDYPSSLPNLSALDLLDEIFIPKSASMKKKKKDKYRRMSALRDSNKSERPAPMPIELEPDVPLLDYLNDPPALFDDPPMPLDNAPLDNAPLDNASLDNAPLDNAPLEDRSRSNKSYPDLAKYGTSRSHSPETLDHVKLRASSRHLSLASPYFNRMLKGQWKEAETLRADGLISVVVKDVDTDALIILMNIIHGRTRSVPKEVNLETLAKIAVIVDIYECAEAVEVFTDMWIAHLRDTLPSLYSRETMLWICISWVFRHSDTFQSATSAAIKHSNSPIQHLGLPIPSSVVSK